MSKGSQVVALLRSAFDARLLGGVLIGVTIMVSTMATAEQSNAGWFSGLFSTGGASGVSVGSASLLSQQDSVVAAAINAEQAKCANGEAGTIGAAIRSAVDVHTQIASVTPAVETLFDATDSCFSGISQIFDLSFAIPSLGSIIANAASAVVRYAEKKVCSAVKKVTGMVTSPINQAINTINSMQQFTDINGMANSAVGGSLSELNSNIGSEYHSTQEGGTYTINSNPFNSSQTAFESSSSTGAATNSTIGGYTSQVNSLTDQVANQHIRVNQSKTNLQSAQRAYDVCVSGDSDCNAQFNALQSAQQTLAQEQDKLIALQSQMTQVVDANNSTVTLGTATLPSVSTSQSAPASSNSSGNWWSGVTNLFK